MQKNFNIMNKIFQVIVCCFIALAMVSCSQEEVKPKNVFSMNLKSATIKPIGLGGDSLTYQSSCNIALMVNSDKHLQLIISDLVLGGKLSSLPITLQLESDDLVVTQSNITTLHFTGKTVKSNLFVLSGIDGNIDLVQKTLAVSFLLNGKQAMQLSTSLEPAAILQLLATIKGQILGSLPQK